MGAAIDSLLQEKYITPRVSVLAKSRTTKEHLEGLQGLQGAQDRISSQATVAWLKNPSPAPARIPQWYI